MPTTKASLQHVRQLTQDCSALAHTARELQFLQEDEGARIKSLEKQLRADRKRKTRNTEYEALYEEQRVQIHQLASQLAIVSREAEKQRMTASMLQARLEHNALSPLESRAQSRSHSKKQSRKEDSYYTSGPLEASDNPLPLPPEPLPIGRFPGFSPGMRDPNAPFPFFIPLSITPHASKSPTGAEPTPSRLVVEHSPPPPLPDSFSPRTEQTPRPVPPPASMQPAGHTPFFSPQPKLPDSNLNAAMLASRPEIATIAKLKDAQAQLDMLLRPEALPASTSLDRDPSDEPSEAIAGPSRSTGDRTHKKKHKHRRPRSDVVERAFPVINEDTFQHAYSEPPAASVSLVNETEKLKYRIDTIDRKGKARERSTPLQGHRYHNPPPAPFSVPSTPTPRNHHDAEDFLHGYEDGYNRGYMAETSQPPRRGSATAVPRPLQSSYSLPQYGSPVTSPPPTRRPGSANSDDSLAGELGGISVAFGGFEVPHRRTLSDASEIPQHQYPDAFMPLHPPPDTSHRGEQGPAGSHRTVYQQFAASDVETTTVPTKRRDKHKRSKTSALTRIQHDNALGLEGFSEADSAGDSGFEVIAPTPKAPDPSFWNSLRNVRKRDTRS